MRRFASAIATAAMATTLAAAEPPAYEALNCQARNGNGHVTERLVCHTTIGENLIKDHATMAADGWVLRAVDTRPLGSGAGAREYVTIYYFQRPVTE